MRAVKKVLGRENSAGGMARERPRAAGHCPVRWGAAAHREVVPTKSPVVGRHSYLKE